MNYNRKGHVFYFFQTLVRYFSYLNVRRHQMVERIFPRQWELSGECRRCGACCDLPTVIVSRFYFSVPGMMRFIIWWHEFWYDFIFEEVNRRERAIVFTCGHLTSDRRCDDYEHRPQMCREYPLIRTWFVKPELFPTCGFTPVRKTDREIEAAVAAFKRNNASLFDESGENESEGSGTSS